MAQLQLGEESGGSRLFRVREVWGLGYGVPLFDAGIEVMVVYSGLDPGT